MMKILLISDCHELYNITNNIIGVNDTILYYTFSSLQNFTTLDCDIAIVDFSQQMVEEGTFHIIIELKGRYGSAFPILALLEESNTQDIFEVLNIGAFDYLDKKELGYKYKNKIEEIHRWKEYLVKHQK